MKKMFPLFLLYTCIILVPAISVSGAIPYSEPVANNSKAVDSPSVNMAVKEFKNLKRSERKERIREAKKAIKSFKANKRAGKAADDETVLLVILSILLPPLAVYLKEDEINTKFWIDLVLTLIFWIPGVIYALLVVFDEV